MVGLGGGVRQGGLLDRVQGCLFGRQAPAARIRSDEIWVGPGVRAVATAHRLGKIAPLMTVVAPSRLSCAAPIGSGSSSANRCSRDCPRAASAAVGPNSPRL
jgi:hypothetical protein